MMGRGARGYDSGLRFVPIVTQDSPKNQGKTYDYHLHTVGVAGSSLAASIKLTSILESFAARDLHALRRSSDRLSTRDVGARGETGFGSAGRSRSYRSLDPLFFRLDPQSYPPRGGRSGSSHLRSRAVRPLQRSPSSPLRQTRFHENNDRSLKKRPVYSSPRFHRA